MILSRRPFPIYDVDAIAVALIAVAALGLYFFAVRPERQQADNYHGVATIVAAAEGAVSRAQGRLGDVSRQIEELQQVLDEQLHQTPTVADRNQLINDILAVADEVGLDVGSITPAAPVEENQVVVSDIEILAEGDIRALITLLDRLAREKPHHAVRGFHVVANPRSPTPSRSIAVTLRLFLLPQRDAVVAGVAP